MTTLWQVRIASGQSMAGRHTFRTLEDAREFEARWRHAEDRPDANAEILRNGVLYIPLVHGRICGSL